ncbi:hypothetical protein ACQPW1_46080 [Nocardia sp. CA-128927]|uniref:hypothetical protein n=1 Tax=Nocardia sp. CA-128927 TaxID=3239975 RepID=UPI003D97BD45
MKFGVAVLAVSILVGFTRLTSLRGRIRRARNGIRAVNAARVRRRRLVRSRGASNGQQGMRQSLDLPQAA